MKYKTRGSSSFHLDALRAVCCAILFVGIQLVVVPSARAWELSAPEWYGPTIDSGDGSFSLGGSGSEGSDPSAWTGPQKVYLDFDTFTVVGEHVYTTTERNAILAGISSIYAPWDFTFTASPTPAPAFPYALLKFNDGGPGGLASDIDFRNLDLGGSAQINVSSLMPLVGLTGTSAEYIGLTTTIGAHELGHLAGLRHADSYGALGKGITTPTPGVVPYNPDYPGPTMPSGPTAGCPFGSGCETGHNTIASPGSTGQSIPQAVAGTHMGERSAVKLEFNESGTVSAEVGGGHATTATAQLLSLPTISVPNTTVAGDLHFGKSLFADAEAVTANIGAVAEVDMYKFSGAVGDIFNIEVISNVPGRLGGNPINSQVRMLMPDGVTTVVQGTGTAFNDDEFESLDSALIDVVLPATGTYYLRVAPLSSIDLGNYELYAYRFRAVPEPASAVLLLTGLAFIANYHHRRSHSSR